LITPYEDIKLDSLISIESHPRKMSSMIRKVASFSLLKDTNLSFIFVSESLTVYIY